MWLPMHVCARVAKRFSCGFDENVVRFSSMFSKLKWVFTKNKYSLETVKGNLTKKILSIAMPKATIPKTVLTTKGNILKLTEYYISIYKIRNYDEILAKIEIVQLTFMIKFTWSKMVPTPQRKDHIRSWGVPRASS